MVISQFVLGECAAFWFWKTSHHPQLSLGFPVFQLSQQTAWKIKFRNSMPLQLKGNGEFSLPFVWRSQLTALWLQLTGISPVITLASELQDKLCWDLPLFIESCIMNSDSFPMTSTGEKNIIDSVSGSFSYIGCMDVLVPCCLQGRSQISKHFVLKPLNVNCPIRMLLSAVMYYGVFQ